MTVEAWLVITREGFRAVFIDRANAERYAATTHGVIVDLVRAPA